MYILVFSMAALRPAIIRLFQQGKSGEKIGSCWISHPEPLEPWSRDFEKPEISKTDQGAEGQGQLERRLTSEKSKAESSEIRTAEKIR